MLRVVKVAPLPEYRLHVEFDDGVAGTIDLSGELDGEVFRPLRDEAMFHQVTVDEFGAVCWPNGPDLAPDAMHSELTAARTTSKHPKPHKWQSPNTDNGAPPPRLSMRLL